MKFSDNELVQQRLAFHEREHRRGLDGNRQENPDTLWWHFRMKVRNITSRYVGTCSPMSVFEIDVHEAWDLFIEAAKVTPP